MKQGMKCGLALVVACFICTALAFAVGPTTGIPPFRSFGGGPDVIDLGNLNVHYSFPVFSRAGRGIPFSYSLGYDSSVFTNLGSAWGISGTGGLTRDIAASVGYVYYTASQRHCIDRNDGSTVYYNVYSIPSYIDSAGTLHYFATLGFNDSDGTCAAANNTASGTATDGSGISMTAHATPNCSCSPTATVTLTNGEKIVPAMGSGGTGGPQTDANGNQITSSQNGNITTFFDTISTTIAVLTIDATNPASVLYKYASPANPAAAVTVSYVSHNVQTAFGCSGIRETLNKLASSR